jgi:hypothetical protein
MIYNRLNRRHFLHGVGKSMLALPFLPSLMSTAEAQSLPNSKCMVMFWTGHGGINMQNLYPIETNPAVMNQLSSTLMYSSVGHSARSGNLVNMKTTRGSNLPYLSSSLGYSIADPLGAIQSANGYGLGFNGNDLDNGLPRVTPIVGSFVSDKLLGKMNIINGLDMMFDSGHARAQSGNYCNADGISVSSTAAIRAGFPNVWIPTIDSVIGKSSSFYGSSSPVARSVVINGQWSGTGDFNQYFSCERASTGIVPNSNIPTSVGAAFNLLFSSLKANSSSSVVSKKDFILNNIYQDYSRLARGAYGAGRRIGKEDRSRLEEFMTNLNSILQGVISNSGATCSVPSISASDTSRITDGEYGLAINSAATPATLSLYNQIITAAFSCGVSKLFMVGLPGLKEQFIPEGSAGATFSDGLNNTDAHQGVFHRHGVANRQQLMVDSRRFYFQNAFYDLMQKLDAVPTGSSGSLLDQSFLFWTDECGFNTHVGQGLPMITAGSAGNFFKTGKYVDYRNPNRLLYSQYMCGVNMLNKCGGVITHQGLPYSRFLGTVMQSMGLSPSEYELSASLFPGTAGRMPITSRGTLAGYGHPFQMKYAIGKTENTAEYVYDYAINDMSVPMPIIT